ncbi:type II toxin-antitoxin system RelE/ParE family toxin [Rhodospira trueperi]|uniref:type II toxin-antitoxin system RelE/ParE family toxin n=1 Tax=Rhodospira trueperi TaxID=69960 RepID=UPI000A66036B|nr:type II toxin-antitoxin system RelE/ParE family toxin [Rhodospira trueperi]
MTRKAVVPRALARADIEAAAEFYREDSGAALALAFVDAVEPALNHVGQFPASGSPRIGVDLDLPDLRCWPVKRFPYLVFYIEHPDHVDVWRGLHERSDVPAWLRPSEGAQDMGMR